MNRTFRGRGLVRAAILVPWAIPTVVVGAGLALHVRPAARGIRVNAARSGVDPPIWFGTAVAAWVPLVLADVWKTTPFVALLLLAGLQNIDASLYEAAGSTAPAPGGSSVTSPCRCSSRRCWWRSSSAPSTPSACSTWSTS